MTSGSLIRFYPDPILRARAKKVTAFDVQLERTVQLMEKVMRSERHGIGIAAPQIGISLQVAIVDVSARVTGAERTVLINPVIRESHQQILSREGCMSIPDYTCQIKRFASIVLEWQDLKGQKRTKRLEGIEGICAQHEVDHLQGSLFLDHVVLMKRDLIPRPRR